MAVYYDSNILAQTFAYANMGNWVIKKVKNAAWVPFINRHSYAINKWFAIGVALASSLSIGYTYSYDATKGWDIHVMIPTVATLWNSFMMFVISYGMQQAGYHVATKEVYAVPGVTTPVVEAAPSSSSTAAPPSTPSKP